MSQRLRSAATVLEVDSLRKIFHSRGIFARGSRSIPAVDGVSFTVQRGQTTALVGESGCGKSTLARLILHLHDADSGRIVLLGKAVEGLSEREFRPFRRHVQMVFQNPLASFDPMYTIGGSIGEVMKLRPAAEMIAEPMSKLAWMRSGATAFGSRWRSRIRLRDAPMLRAASTYSRCRSESTWPLARRA